MAEPSFRLREVAHGSAEYLQIVALRYDILRKPLGMVFTEEQLKAEHDKIHLALFTDDEPVACCMLIPFGDKVQMKQVAVKESMQGSGLGSSLLKATEDYALAKGFSLMYCHARETAVAFYTRNGYIIKGDMFEEIGIAHYYMEKSL